MKNNLVKMFIRFFTNKGKLKGDLKQVDKALDKTGRNAKKASEKGSSGFKKFALALKSPLAGALALVVSFGKLIATFGSAIRESNKLEERFASISSLFKGQEVLLESTKKKIQDLSVAYGQDASASAKAYYDIVSSGTTDQAKANEYLEASLKLSLATVSDVSHATDALTTVMNSYRGSALTSAEASDILFTIIQRGKTTMPELAGSLGQITSLANVAGLSFQELGASIALLTQRGIKTDQTMTLLKGVLNSFAKQEGKEAQTVIKKMGIEWNVATLKANGLAFMIEKLSKATGGNLDEMAKLIPNIRGVTGAVNLLAEGGNALKRELDATNESAGALDQSVEKINETFIQKFKVATEKNKQALRDLGRELQSSALAWLNFKTDVVNAIGAISRFLKSNNILSVSLRSVGKALKTIFKPISMGFKYLSKSQEEYNKTLQKTKELAQGTTGSGQTGVAPASLEQSTASAISEEQKSHFKFMLDTGAKIADISRKTKETMVEAFKKIDERTKSIIDKLKENFSGRGLGALAGARQELGDNANLSTFRRFRGQVDPASLATGQAVANLAKASVIFDRLSDVQKSSFEKLITQMKRFGATVDAEDFLETAKAVEKIKEIGPAFKELLDTQLKGIKEASEDVKLKAEDKKELLRKENIEKMQQTVSNLIEQNKIKADLESKNVAEFKNQVDAFKAGVESFQRVSKQPVILDFKRDAGKFITQLIEKELRNNTNNNKVFK